jgi:membrane protein implicated in regulation of membrane protease activity
MKPIVFKELGTGWIAVGVAAFVGLLLYGFTGLSYELLALPAYVLLAVFWVWRRLIERSDEARSTGNR